MSRPVVGSVFQERYLILSELGAGGMGSVYRARQTDAERDVALKVPHIDEVTDREVLVRFLREFKLLSRLSNEHIMAIYGLALDDESVPFAICEYLEGMSLRKALRDGALSWRRAVHIANQICIGMQEAHGQGILHRDLKPENILLLSKPEPDFVKIIDFGLSRLFVEISESQKITKSGKLMGSVHYMAPEQVSGLNVDARCDIYALSCMIFEMLAGEYLFDADSALGIIYRHNKENPESRLRLLSGKVPPQMVSLLAKGLAKLPGERYQSMSEFSSDLQSIASSELSQAIGDETIQLKSPTFGQGSKKAWALGIASVAILILLGVALLVSSRSHSERNGGRVQKSRRDQNQRPVAETMGERPEGTAIEDPRTLIEKGDALLQSSPHEAIPLFKKTLAHSSSYGQTHPEWLYKAHLSLGHAYIATQRFADAAAEFQQAEDVYKDPMSANRLTAAASRSYMLLYTKKNDEAVSSLQAVVSQYEKKADGHIDLPLVHAKNSLAYIMGAAQKNVEAVKLAKATLLEIDQYLDRQSIDAVDLSWLLYSSGQTIGKAPAGLVEIGKTKKILLDEANSRLKKGVQSAVFDPEYHEELGGVLYRYAVFAAQNGFVADARQFLSLALKLPTLSSETRSSCMAKLAELPRGDEKAAVKFDAK